MVEKSPVNQKEPKEGIWIDCFCWLCQWWETDCQRLDQNKDLLICL